MRDRVAVRAPVRVDFAGGGSDVAPFALREWGYVVNAAIDKYAHVTVRRRPGSAVVLISDDLRAQAVYPSRAALTYDGPLRLLARAVQQVGAGGGLEVRVRTDVPAGSGLGASAAVGVALLYALAALDGAVPADMAGVARAAVRLETEGLQNTGGGQDQFAAAFGGLQSLRFAGGSVARKDLAISAAVRAALDRSLLLCDSGMAHVSGTLLAVVMDRYQAGHRATIAALYRLRAIALEVEAVLESGDVAGLGPLLSANWAAFRAFHAGISTPAIERILAIAGRHGASGGKATGAGGGGCVLLACDPERRDGLAAALAAAGIGVIPFTCQAPGVAVVVG